jgi:hypothetical protein
MHEYVDDGGKNEMGPPEGRLGGKILSAEKWTLRRGQRDGNENFCGGDSPILGDGANRERTRTTVRVGD